MRYAVFGIDNREFFDVRRCEFAKTTEERDELVAEFEKEYPLVLTEVEAGI